MCIPISGTRLRTKDLGTMLTSNFMVLLIRAGGDAMSSFDTDVVAASVSASSTITLITKTGHGVAILNIAGNGNVNVTLKYNIDGAGDTNIDTSDVRGSITLSYTTSLLIKATNGSGSPQNHSTVALTGLQR